MNILFSMTDEQLVAAYAQGNNNAFDVLMSRHKESLFGYILYISRNRELAEDIFQETFIKAITTIKQGKYVESGKFKAWITRIAHNLVFDYFRREKREKTLYNDEYEYDLFNHPSFSEDNIETTMVKSQIIKDVRHLVELLPDAQKEVLKMRYYKDMSFKDIAERTGVSINTALGRMRYAIINIQKMVKENQLSLTFN